MAIRLAVGALLVLLIVYGSIKALPLLRGPVLHIDTPKQDGSEQDGFTLISGTAIHTASLALNGAPLLIDEGGHFSQTLLLPHGGAILTLTATDRFGRSETVRRAVFVP